MTPLRKRMLDELQLADHPDTIGKPFADIHGVMGTECFRCQRRSLWQPTLANVQMEMLWEFAPVDTLPVGRCNM